MKLNLILLIVCIGIFGLQLATSVGAPPDPRRVVTINGVTYTGVTWGPLKDGEVLLIHDGGQTQISIDDLPDRVRSTYGLAPNTATRLERSDDGKEWYELVNYSGRASLVTPPFTAKNKWKLITTGNVGVTPYIVGETHPMPRRGYLNDPGSYYLRIRPGSGTYEVRVMVQTSR